MSSVRSSPQSQPQLSLVRERFGASSSKEVRENLAQFLGRCNEILNPPAEADAAPAQTPRLSLTLMVRQLAARAHQHISTLTATDDSTVRAECVAALKIDPTFFPSLSALHFTAWSAAELKKFDLHFWRQFVSVVILRDHLLSNSATHEVESRRGKPMTEKERTDYLTALLKDPEHFAQMKGADGYRRVAQLFFAGNLRTTNFLIKEICRAHHIDFKALGWPYLYPGLVANLQSDVALLQQAATRQLERDKNPAVPPTKEEMWGVAWVLSFADTHCEGDLKEAFRRLHASCDQILFDDKQFILARGKTEQDGAAPPTLHKVLPSFFKWGNTLSGTTAAFRAEKAWVWADWHALADTEPPLDENKTPPTGLKGLSGLRSYALAYCDGNLSDARRRMKSICLALNQENPAVGHISTETLGWDEHEIHITVAQFDTLNASFKNSWKTIVLPPSTGRSVEEMRGKLFPINEMQFGGHAGLFALAHRFFDGSMTSAYYAGRAMADIHGHDFTKLGWGSGFIGSTKQFLELATLFGEHYPALIAKVPPPHEGRVHANFDLSASGIKGEEGAKLFAKLYFNGQLHSAKRNVHSVCHFLGLDYGKLDWGEIEIEQKKTAVLKGEVVEKDPFFASFHQIRTDWNTRASRVFPNGRFGYRLEQSFIFCCLLAEDSKRWHFTRQAFDQKRGERDNLGPAFRNYRSVWGKTFAQLTAQGLIAPLKGNSDKYEVTLLGQFIFALGKLNEAQAHAATTSKT